MTPTQHLLAVGCIVVILSSVETLRADAPIANNQSVTCVVKAVNYSICPDMIDTNGGTYYSDTFIVRSLPTKGYLTRADHKQPAVLDTPITAISGGSRSDDRLLVGQRHRSFCTNRWM